MTTTIGPETVAEPALDDLSEPSAAPSAPASTGFSVNPELTGEDGENPNLLPAGVFLEGDEIPAERQELFRVNGRVYTVAKHIDPRIAFRYMRAVRKGRGDEAAANMMYDVLGEAVIDALADENLEPDHIKAVMKAAEKYAMSAIRVTLGN